VDDAARRHGSDAQAHRGRVLSRVAVIGSTGQLGSDLVEAFAGHDVTGLAHGDIEIRDPESIRSVLGRIQPEIVVNTAAAHNVPRCETDEADAYAANAVAPRHLARTCAELGARLVHVSTDYVFDGVKHAPYVETDRPNPLNVYGNSKLAGEYAVLNADGGHQVVRSSGLYGLRPCRAKGGNFIDTMFKLARERDEVRVVDDEVLTPTFTADLAGQIRTLALDGPPGLYHATNHGQCSWYQFARVIFELGGLTTKLTPTTVREFSSPVRRPFYSVLDNAALGAAGLDRMRPWRDALTDYMHRRLAAAGRPAAV
jgi:dTDP-4-dehydrorhamnose reductase